MQLERSLGQLLQVKKLLIFDFDGTVADTSHLHSAAFEQVLSPLAISVQYPLIAGMKTEDAIVYCAKTCGCVIPRDLLMTLVKAKQEIVREMIVNHLKPLPGMDAFLHWARQLYPLSMATSGSRSTVRLALEKLGYKDWFTPLVCAEDVERAKPHPDMFLKVLQLTQISTSDALIFEDSESGFVAAESAQIPCFDVRGVDWRLELSKLTGVFPS